MNEDWRTEQFRMSMVRRLDEAIQERGLTNQSAQSMENQAFQRARGKEEYLNCVARLIIMIKQRPNPNNPPSQNNQATAQPQDSQMQQVTFKFPMATLHHSPPFLF